MILRERRASQVFRCRVTAAAALEQMARSLGQMHAATAGAAHAYRSLRDGLRSWYDLWPGRFDLRLTAYGPRLIDFEAGGMRSALMDGAYFRMLFPTCWCAGPPHPGRPLSWC